MDTIVNVNLWLDIFDEHTKIPPKTRGMELNEFISKRKFVIIGPPHILSIGNCPHGTIEHTIVENVVNSCRRVFIIPCRTNTNNHVAPCQTFFGEIHAKHVLVVVFVIDVGDRDCSGVDLAAWGLSPDGNNSTAIRFLRFVIIATEILLFLFCLSLIHI